MSPFDQYFLREPHKNVVFIENIFQPMSSCENPQTSFYLRAHYPVRVERRGRDSGQTNHITRPKLSVPEASQLEQLQRCRKKKTVSSLLPLQLVAFHCDSWLKVIHVLVLLSKTYCSLEQWFLTIGSRPNFGHQHHLEGRKKTCGPRETAEVVD